jgi:multidrug efflux pump subunit AcrA (membrane-fusion protein)
LRSIQQKSIQDTKDLISLNESIPATIDTTINTSTNSAEIQGSQQLKAQLLSGVIQLRGQLRSTEYLENGEKPPAQLSNVQKEMTLKQLELQEKALDLQKEVSRLQVQVSRVQESLLSPSAPYPGVIERIFVRKGQQVNPGTPIATLYCDQLSVKLVAKVSREVAQRVSLGQTSTVVLAGQRVELYPYYVSQVATDEQLYSIQYMLPQEWISAVTDKGTVTIEIPIGFADTAATISYIPLDAVHQLQDQTLAYVVEDGAVVSRQLQLGTVQGRFVEVLSGLLTGDQIILDRNVITGEQVAIR